MDDSDGEGRAAVSPADLPIAAANAIGVCTPHLGLTEIYGWAAIREPQPSRGSSTRLMSVRLNQPFSGQAIFANLVDLPEQPACRHMRPAFAQLPATGY